MRSSIRNERTSTDRSLRTIRTTYGFIKAKDEGADNGPLAGKTIGLKDNISLAGIELTNGSQLFEGYNPMSTPRS